MSQYQEPTAKILIFDPFTGHPKTRSSMRGKQNLLRTGFYLCMIAVYGGLNVSALVSSTVMPTCRRLTKERRKPLQRLYVRLDFLFAEVYTDAQSPCPYLHAIGIMI
ncbi:hypothetical protein M434DRAFT_27771 [Hypoxylon sp. CO27-5]|nr:hypothetical protein M434DRAFT_27771 [Hypoxylon sp. CO27-5]